MNQKCEFKVAYKELEKSVLFKGNLFDSQYEKFDSIKNDIFKKTNANKKIFGKVQVTKDDKFVLEIEGFDAPGLDSIWNIETYNYFYGRIQDNPPEKIKFIIKKVEKYPEWNPPQYETILKNSLNNFWTETKKELLDELTEKYLNDGKRLFIRKKKEKDPNLKEELFSELHVNIVCNNCLSANFSGARYICCECEDFNICEYCQENTRITHSPEHTFIKLNNPTLVDIQKYNCIFSPNKKLLKNSYEPFEIEVEIFNSGENNLQGCFISPIRFGKNYLGCLKKTIINQCERGNKTKLQVLMKFEDDDEEEEITPLDEYEGYFKLMTPEGIPFGDIFYLKVIIENNENNL